MKPMRHHKRAVQKSSQVFSEGISGALHAVKSGNSEVLRYFLEKGYNVNQTDSQVQVV